MFLCSREDSSILCSREDSSIVCSREGLLRIILVEDYEFISEEY